MGRSPRELYVWAYCTGYLPGGILTAASVPAALTLADDGRPIAVRVPGDGSLYAKDVRSLFPADIQDRELRGLLAALPESPCRPLDMSLGYRGFVVQLAQRPELSNEYRLRVYARQVRWGDPWNPEAPGASCRSDTGRQVERFLLAGGQSQLPEVLYKSLALELEGAATGTPK